MKDHDEDFVVPPEKERKRLVLVISCVGLTMTFLAAIMVGITLGFSQTMDEKSASKQKPSLQYSSFFKYYFLPQKYTGVVKVCSICHVPERRLVFRHLCNLYVTKARHSLVSLRCHKVTDTYD